MNESDSLKKQIAALQSIISELDHMQAITLDVIDSQDIFEKKLMVDDIRLMKQRELDDIQAGNENDNALTPAQIQDLQGALTQLHTFVRNDQAISMGISFLLQVADQVKGLS
jgi:hypothetical protein